MLNSQKGYYNIVYKYMVYRNTIKKNTIRKKTTKKSKKIKYFYFWKKERTIKTEEVKEEVMKMYLNNYEEVGILYYNFDDLVNNNPCSYGLFLYEKHHFSYYNQMFCLIFHHVTFLQIYMQLSPLLNDLYFSLLFYS